MSTPSNTSAVQAWIQSAQDAHAEGTLEHDVQLAAQAALQSEHTENELEAGEDENEEAETRDNALSGAASTLLARKFAKKIARRMNFVRNRSKSEATQMTQNDDSDARSDAQSTAQGAVNSQAQDISFNFAQFFLDTIYHLMGPFSFLPCWLVEGYIACLNRSFLPARGGGVFFWFLNTVFWVCTFLPALLLFSFPNKMSCLSASTVGACIVFMCLRCLVIGAKYGYFPAEDLKKMRRVTTSARWRQDRMLLGGLVEYRRDWAVAELRKAQASTGYNLENWHFYGDNDVMEERNQPGTNRLGASTISTRNRAMSTVETFSAFEFILQVLLDAQLQTKRDVARYNSFVNFLVIFNVLAPITTKAIYCGNIKAMFGSNAMEVASLSLWMFGIFALVRNVYAFYIAGIAEFIRRKRFNWRLADLVHPRSTEGALVDLSHPNNIVLWLMCREVMQNFGARFVSRVTVMASFILGAVMIVFIVLIGSSLQADRSISDFDLFVLVVMALESFTLTMFLIHEGAQLNQANKKDILTLSEMQVSIQEKLSCDSIPEAVRARYQSSLPFLATAIKQVRLRDQVIPVTILGFRASGTLIKAALTALAGAMSITVDVYAKAVSQAQGNEEQLDIFSAEDLQQCCTSISS